jgi:integrase
VAIKCLMSWVKSRKGWMKEYRGRKYAVSCRQLGKPETKEDSYLAANAWWTARKAQIDAAYRGVAREPLPLEDVIRPTQPEGLYEGDAEALAQVPEDLLERIDGDISYTPPERVPGRPGVYRVPQPGDDQQRDLRQAHQRAALDFLYRYLLNRVPLPPDVTENIPPPQLAALEALRGGQAAPGRTVADQAAAWLNGQELRMAAREISPGGYDNKRRWLNKFLDFVGRTTDVGLITDDLLERFDAHCLERRAKHVEGREGGWSDITVDEARGVAREWVGWLADHNVIPRPAWLSRRRRGFRVMPRDIRPWTPAQFQAVLGATYRDEVKLIFLLGANAGMTQKDCTDLKPAEVDWQAGYLERRRSKSAHVGNAPVVRYKLWPTTLALLRKCNKGGDRVITTRDGTPYVNERFVGGKRVRVDSFHRHFQRVKERLAESLPDFDGTPKGVRKMSATLLASHPTYGRFVAYFLGHAPRSIADRHYARTDQGLFDEAVTWLGRQLGQVE